MEVLVFISGGGTIISGHTDPVAFEAGDCVLIPAAFEGAITFDRDTVYLAVTL
jgi:uncharacterized cupin superfamily protein